jgi:hypothetical protein
LMPSMPLIQDDLSGMIFQNNCERRLKKEELKRMKSRKDDYKP